MKNIRKHISLAAAALLPVAASAIAPISFETEDYAKIGAYDTWEASPFRTGALTPNVAVVDNPAVDAETNSTAKVLGFQRSIHGSNTYGARIGLTEPLTIEDGLKYYAHVLMNKPVDGRVMLIGLGKRADRDGQSNEVEQFWAYPVNDVKTGEWFDAVFAVKCNPGVEIHSLVVVPHCEAPHTIANDFVAYIDEIEINSQLQPRIGVSDYPINYSTSAGWGRSDRMIRGLSLNGGSDGNQSISISANDLTAYMEIFNQPFLVKAGNTVTPSVNYSGSWMHSYFYLDRGKDGNFSAAVGSDNKLDTTTDLFAYSYYSGTSQTGYNSAGTYQSSSNIMTMPSFTVPADLANGYYRVRYKVDWNSIDPGGSIADGNHILNNGGGIIDVLLNVHGDYCTVNQDNRNGEIRTADGEIIDNYRAPFGQSLKIKMVPSNGFTYNGVRVRHGYNLTGDSLVKSTPQFRDDFFYISEFDADDTFSIPASVMDGDVLIEGLFVEQGQGMTRKSVTYRIVLDGQVIDTQVFNVISGQEYPMPSVESEASQAYYTLTGFPEGTTTAEDEVITLTLEQTLPFETSRSHVDAVWYHLTITSGRNYLTHTPSQSYISLASTTTVEPAADDYNSQWAFVGNVLTGFSIINRGAGPGYVLSSSTNTSSNTGGNTYPVMTASPVPSTHNEMWIPTVSNYISGHDGFCLHQKGYTTNRMNSRDNRLAYWTGGADGGSTFIALLADRYSAIDGIEADADALSGDAVFYNLQGMKVNTTNLTPGIYIRRQTGRTTKVYIR